MIPRRDGGRRRGPGDQCQPRSGLRLLRAGSRLARTDRPCVTEATVSTIEVSRRRRRPSAAGRVAPHRPLGAARAGRPRRVGARPAAELPQHHPARPRPGFVGGRHRGRPAGRASTRRPVIPTRRGLLRHATAIEGHPDNVAAAILRRLRAGVRRPRRGRRRRAPGDLRPAVAVFTPPQSVATKAARAAARTGAARRRRRQRRPGRAAGARAGRRTDLLERPGTGCTRSYREPAMPRSYELVTQLRGEGSRR